MRILSSSTFVSSLHPWVVKVHSAHQAAVLITNPFLCHHPAGDRLVVSTSGPGIFLQGLAVHGPSGALLPGAALDRGVVAAAFEYAERTGVPLCAFLGDSCATLRMAPRAGGGCGGALCRRHQTPMRRPAQDQQHRVRLTVALASLPEMGSIIGLSSKVQVLIRLATCTPGSEVSPFPVQELNTRYYEPLAAVLPSADELLALTVKKLALHDRPRPESTPS